MAITIDQAVKRFKQEAERHRKEGRWSAGHEYQRSASQLASLARQAEGLPPARKKRER
jgi:hypothetical protein